MNCPHCLNKAARRGGGSNGNITYYACAACDIAFSLNRGEIRIMESEPLLFRNSREAAHCLYQAVRDDRQWFGTVTEETETLARMVLREYLLRRRNKPAVRVTSQITFGYARRKERKAA